jgi:hypothetical protein
VGVATGRLGLESYRVMVKAESLRRSGQLAARGSKLGPLLTLVLLAGCGGTSRPAVQHASTAVAQNPRTSQGSRPLDRDAESSAAPTYTQIACAGDVCTASGQVVVVHSWASPLGADVNRCRGLTRQVVDQVIQEVNAAKTSWKRLHALVPPRCRGAIHHGY